MSDFVLDADPFIPSGVEATPEEVADMVADGRLPADKVALLHERQRPAEEVLVAAADRVGSNTPEQAKNRMKAAGLIR